MECMQPLEKLDPFLQTFKPPLYVTYLSPSSQNEMSQSTSDFINSRVVSEIKKAKMFSIMVNEAWSSCHCVQYIGPQVLLQERFHEFSQHEAFDASSITDTIQKKLQKHEIRHLTCQ